MEVATKYQSHLPALLSCVSKTIGPVVEIGVGHFSTPVLNAVCGAMDRQLYSIETDVEWLQHFKDMFRGSIHHNFLSSWPYKSEKVGVCFIDDSPGGENRANSFKQFLPVSQFVVVHDYHAENEEAIGPLLHGVDHKVWSDYSPPTLVASKFRGCR